jgi:PAS domain S-box-containing protein
MRNNKSMELNTAQKTKFITGLIKHVPQPMIVTSADRGLLYWNAAFSKLTGYNNKELSDPIKSAGLTAPEWHEGEIKALEKLKRTGKSQTFRKEYIRKDGSRVPVEVLIYQTSIDNGKTQQYVGLITDITERKNVEEASRYSEERYRTILEAIEEGYWEVDLAGNFVYFNNAICRLLGYSENEMTGMNYRAYTAAEDVTKVYKAFNQVFRTGKPIRNMHYEIVQKDKSQRFAETSVFPRQNEKGETIGFRGVSHDITERRNMEEVLRQSEEKYRTILDEIDDGYFEVDLAGNYTFTNRTFSQSLKYSPDELIGVNYKQTTAPEEIDEIFHRFNQVYKTGEPARNFDTTYIRKDGSIGFTDFAVSPIRNKKGDIIGFRGVTHDITERMAMNNALKQSEEKYRRILEQMRESYFELDLAGRFTFFNDSLCRGLGYSKEELIGMSYKVYTPPEEVERVFQAYNQVYRTGEPLNLFSFKQIRKDGTRLVVENSVSPIRNEKGEIIGFRGVGRNITERIQAEEALKRSEERYRTILDDIEEGYYETDLAGNYTFFNDVLCKKLGYSREELVGINYQAHTDPEDVKKISEAYYEIYSTGKPLKWFSPAQIRKDGTRIFAEDSVSLLRDEKGEIVGFHGVSRDITERKQIEEALRRSEERYRTLLDEMETPYYEDDLAGNFTFVNDAMCRSLGYSREELIGMNYKVYTPPEEVERVFKAYNQVYRTGKPTALFARESIHKDGRLIPVETSILPLKNDRGEIIGFRGISHDVTERKKIEESLRQSEERYRTILEEIQENYFEVDLAGHYTFVNDAVCRGLGYTFDELIGKSFKLSTTSDEAKRLYEAFHQIYLTGQPAIDFSYAFVTKNGRNGTGELSAFPIRNDKSEIVGFRGIGHDVTERVRMEEALRQSEERYRTVLEDMQEAYYELDLAGNYTFFNEALCRQLGYSKEELIGMNYKVYTPPEMVKEVFQAYNLIYRTGEPLRSFPMERIKKDGTRIFAEASGFPLQDEKGEIIGFKGVVNDVTDRKQADKERKELEQKAQLASRLASVGELASGVAHEINNPLTGVIGYAHLLLARKDLSRDVRRDLEIINEGAQRVAGIVKKLLTFARQTKPEERYVNINELIRNTLELRAYELSANNIKVTLQLTRDMPMTIADPGQLQQVFLNLIINAETEMKLANDKGKLSIKTERMNNTLQISFKDTGPGIAKENLETIFDPFFTTREVGQGTGLGLSVCHGIVTEHNGKIWAESEPGKGATFIVELPLVTEEGQFEPAEPAPEESPRVTKAKILVVDDEPVIRQFISQVLSEQGHIVETIDNAASALKMVKSKRYRLILLDIKMPGMSGIELYKQFQKIAPSLTKRIVFVTGDVMGKRTIGFLDKTKTPYLMKPFDAKQLKAEINRILVKK